MFKKIFNHFKKKEKKDYKIFYPSDYEIKNYFWDGNKEDSGNKFIEAAIYDMFLKNIHFCYSIIPHVSLREIFVTNHKEDWYPYLAFLATHHVDFLIIDRTCGKPILAIEICGSYHKEDLKQIKSDNFKKELFRRGNIPIFFLDLEENILDPNFYRELFHNYKPIIPVYHTRCNCKMTFIQCGPYGPYYRCPTCTSWNGKSYTISIDKVSNII